MPQSFDTAFSSAPSTDLSAASLGVDIYLIIPQIANMQAGGGARQD